MFQLSLFLVGRASTTEPPIRARHVQVPIKPRAMLPLAGFGSVGSCTSLQPHTFLAVGTSGHLRRSSSHAAPCVRVVRILPLVGHCQGFMRTLGPRRSIFYVMASQAAVQPAPCALEPTCVALPLPPAAVVFGASRANRRRVVMVVNTGSLHVCRFSWHNEVCRCLVSCSLS